MARPVAFNNQVHVRDQLEQQPAAGGGFEIQGNAFLVQVQDQEEQALFGVGGVVIERPEAAHGRPAGRFDLEHVSSVVGQQPGAERPGDVLAQIKNLDARQRA